jgi:hypothetical protein
VDGDEVEPLDEGDAGDAEDGEVEELAPADPEGLRPRQRQHEREAEEGAGRAHLGQLERREPGRVEHDLRDGAVDREQDRGSPHHRVAEQRTPVARPGGEVDDRPGHRARA